MSLSLIIGNKKYSSWSLRPWLFLRHHDIEFQEVRIPLYQAGSKAEIQRYSAAGKVPVLWDGELPIWDSLAILEYLAERFPQTQGWPEDFAERALARALAAEMHSGFMALREHCGMNVSRTPAAKALPDAAKADAARIDAIWRECRQRYAERGPWLFGRFTIADAMFAPVALRFQAYALPHGPESRDYIETVLAEPAMQEWLTAGRAETEVLPQFE